MGNVRLYGSTSGYTELAAPAVAPDGVLTLPAVAGTLATTADVAAAGITSDGSVQNASETTASTSFTDLATVGPSVTVTTGTKALVLIGAMRSNTISGGVSLMGFAVSGASTIAASDANSVFQQGTVQESSSKAVYVDGLTAGSNTFTAKYRATSGTGQFQYRQISVIDMGS